MNTSRSIEYLTGFLMGIFLGSFFETAFIGILNLLGNWLGWARLVISWWMLIPIPLVVGLIMARVIASLHLEDY